jgi:DNA-binding NarL/FixJ family response regulator
MVAAADVSRNIPIAPLRILLVDDSAEFLASATRFLTIHHDLQVVGCARSGRDALAQVAALTPDLVLIDLAMPEMNGLETTRQLKARAEVPRIVLMTLYDVAEYREAAREAAADGFIAKSAIRSDLLPMIACLFVQAVGHCGSPSG